MALKIILNISHNYALSFSKKHRKTDIFFDKRRNIE